MPMWGNPLSYIDPLGLAWFDLALEFRTSRCMTAVERGIRLTGKQPIACTGKD
jgi:hypothetical protein